MTDDDLVEQIKLGREEAAEELIKRYYLSIFHYCKRHCFSLEKAEDLTQETFLKLFQNLSGYQEKKKFKAYLYTIANRLCIDESRKTKVYFLENEDKIRHECKELHQIENEMEIEVLLNLLTEEQREAVLLRYREQFSYREIARIMGCNIRTAQSRVRNALKIMRRGRQNEK